MELAARQNAGGNWTSGKPAPEATQFLLTQPKSRPARFEIVSAELNPQRDSTKEIPGDAKSLPAHAIAQRGNTNFFFGNAVAIADNLKNIPANANNMLGNTNIIVGGTNSIAGSTKNIFGNTNFIPGNTIFTSSRTKTTTNRPISVKTTNKTS